MDWMETQLCLRCNNGDELLLCNEDGCPIVVHKKCLGCEAHFDDFGNFYCPYCIFKRVTEDMRIRRDKAIAAKKILLKFITEDMRIISDKGIATKKNLLKFIEEKMADDTNRHIPKSSKSTSKEPVSPLVAENKSCCESEKNLKMNVLGNHGVHLEKHNLEERSPKYTSTHLPFGAHDDGNIQKDTESLAPELNLQSNFIDILVAQQPIRWKRKNSPEPSNSIQLEQPSKRHTEFSLLNAKRGKLFWTAEEEKMLKEGVEKFPKGVNNKIPWKKILDFGCHVFNPSRTPVDLKDKWRNIVGKSIL